MKNFLVMLICLIMVASAKAQKVNVSGFNLSVTSSQAQEIKKSKWQHSFRLENTTGGDACPCGIIDGVYYIASPDLSQEYLVGPKGLTRVVNQLPSYIDGVWAEAGEPFKGHKVKYIFAYKGDDVYVIVYGK